MDTLAMILELYSRLDDLSYATHKEQWDALERAISVEQQDKDVRENGDA